MEGNEAAALTGWIQGGLVQPARRCWACGGSQEVSAPWNAAQKCAGRSCPQCGIPNLRSLVVPKGKHRGLLFGPSLKNASLDSTVSLSPTSPSTFKEPPFRSKRRPNGFASMVQD